MCALLVERTSERRGRGPTSARTRHKGWRVGRRVAARGGRALSLAGLEALAACVSGVDRKKERGSARGCEREIDATISGDGGRIRGGVVGRLLKWNPLCASSASSPCAVLAPLLMAGLGLLWCCRAQNGVARRGGFVSLPRSTGPGFSDFSPESLRSPGCWSRCKCDVNFYSYIVLSSMKGLIVTTSKVWRKPHLDGATGRTTWIEGTSRADCGLERADAAMRRQREFALVCISLLVTFCERCDGSVLSKLTLLLRHPANHACSCASFPTHLLDERTDKVNHPPPTNRTSDQQRKTPRASQMGAKSCGPGG